MSARPPIEFLRPKWRIWGLFLLLVMVGTPVHSDDGPVITQIDHSSLSGGRLQIDVRSSGVLPSPRVFRTSEPDRIVLDFFGVRTQLPSSVIEVGRGAIESIMMAQDEERSRMVINLISAVGFVSDATDNRLTLVMGPVTLASGDSAGTDTSNGKNAQPGQDLARVGLIDFRRTPAGAGRVILEFDSERP